MKYYIIAINIAACHGGYCERFDSLVLLQPVEETVWPPAIARLQ